MENESDSKKSSIKNWAEDDRPREKLISKGNASLSNAELLAILIGSGNADESAVELSRRILASVNDNLAELSKISLGNLQKNFKGIGEAKAVTISAALELGHRRMHTKTNEKKNIISSRDAFDVIYENLSDLPYEEFWVIFLNRKNCILSKNCISVGGITESVADPRKILKLALENNATSIILAHNHPSGSITPSQSDISISHKIKSGAEILGIHVLDHIIIGDNKTFYSFADEGVF